jgi:hypothetical protein
MVEVDQQALVNTNVVCIRMKSRKQTSTRKCSERAVWMLNRLLIRRKRDDSAGDVPSPVMRASGAARKTVTK